MQLSPEAMAGLKMKLHQLKMLMESFSFEAPTNLCQAQLALIEGLLQQLLNLRDWPVWIATNKHLIGKGCVDMATMTEHTM